MPANSVFRDNLLAGKCAFLTGATSGIGLRMAERFAEHGAKVYLIGRKEDKLRAAIAAIEGADGAVADVRDYAAVEAAAADAKAKFGPIDIVLCGAAGNFPAPAAEMSANGFKAVVDIDLLGTFNAARATWAHLRKPGASVVMISAGQAMVPMAMQAHVCAAKAGVDMLMKSLAVEWGAAGVRLNSITPGPTDDTEGMRRLAPSDEIRKQVARSVPLGRFGSKDELADLALFLCSDAASYITGGIFTCDGGSSLTARSLLSGLQANA